jgi:hypothetical protein
MASDADRALGISVVHATARGLYAPAQRRAVASTASIYFHWFADRAHAKRIEDPSALAMAAVFLAGKVENAPRAVADVCSCGLSALDGAAPASPWAPQSPPGGALPRWSSAHVLHQERELLYVIGFAHFNVEHAHALLDEAVVGAPRELALHLADVVYRSHVCVEHSARELAEACVRLARAMLLESPAAAAAGADKIGHSVLAALALDAPGASEAPWGTRAPLGVTCWEPELIADLSAQRDKETLAACLG